MGAVNMPGMYTVVEGSKHHRNLTFLEALRLVTVHFEENPDKPASVEMYRQVLPD